MENLSQKQRELLANLVIRQIREKTYYKESYIRDLKNATNVKNQKKMPYLIEEIPIIKAKYNVVQADLKELEDTYIKLYKIDVID